jgi:hypothetical protein
MIWDLGIWGFGGDLVPGEFSPVANSSWEIFAEGLLKKFFFIYNNSLLKGE